jgi:hypothetical protein
MGKKGKPEDELQYEVWISTTSGWKRVEENGNGGVFVSKQRSLLMAENKSHGEDVIETMVIERRPIVVYNGPAISAKHLMAAAEKKKEKDHGEVHRSRAQENDLPDPGAQLGGEAAPGGRVGEGAPVGPG